MEKEQVKKIVVDIINEILPDEDCSNLDSGKLLREQLDLDSMDFLDIVMELRKQYNVEIPEADYDELATLDSSANYLASKM